MLRRCWSVKDSMKNMHSLEFQTSSTALQIMGAPPSNSQARAIGVSYYLKVRVPWTISIVYTIWQTALARTKAYFDRENIRISPIQDSLTLQGMGSGTRYAHVRICTLVVIIHCDEWQAAAVCTPSPRAYVRPVTSLHSICRVRGWYMRYMVPTLLTYIW